MDLDDARTGPAVQDLWMLLSGDRAQRQQQLGALVDGYEQFREFDRDELALIEPLRTLRLIHYSAWLARRWDDPTFPINFPWFGSSDYWQGQVQMLEEQIEAMEEPPLVAVRPASRTLCAQRSRVLDAPRCRRSRPAPRRRACRYFGGLKPMPTPTGVPVAIRSPGYSVMPADSISISVGMSKIKSLVLASWRSSPLTQQCTSVSWPSISSALTSHGPIGQKVSKDLPSSHCEWRPCQSRAVTSLTMV